MKAEGAQYEYVYDELYDGDEMPRSSDIGDKIPNKINQLLEAVTWTVPSVKH